MKTIYDLIADEMVERGDSIEEIISTTHSLEDLKGMSELSNLDGFTLWTKNRVYFPSTYETQYNIESVPRNPCHEICGVLY